MIFVVRPASQADVPGILAADLDAGRTSLANAERFAASISAAVEDRTRLVVVAEAQDDANAGGGYAGVGWAKTHHWDYDDGPALSGHYLGGVTVRPDFRRLGAAAELTGARGPGFHTVKFDAGEGVLLQAARPLP